MSVCRCGGLQSSLKKEIRPAKTQASTEHRFKIGVLDQLCIKAQNSPPPSSPTPAEVRVQRALAAGPYSKACSPLTPWHAWRFQRASLQIGNRPKKLGGAWERSWCHQLQFRRACRCAASSSRHWAGTMQQRSRRCEPERSGDRHTVERVEFRSPTEKLVASCLTSKPSLPYAQSPAGTRPDAQAGRGVQPSPPSTTTAVFIPPPRSRGREIWTAVSRECQTMS